jgi:hypothetical protein
MAVIQYTFTHKEYIEQHNSQQDNAMNNCLGRVRAVPGLCELYHVFCLITDEKARKTPF